MYSAEVGLTRQQFLVHHYRFQFMNLLGLQIILCSMEVVTSVPMATPIFKNEKGTTPEGAMIRHIFLSEVTCADSSTNIFDLWSKSRYSWKWLAISGDGQLANFITRAINSHTITRKIAALLHIQCVYQQNQLIIYF